MSDGKVYEMLWDCQFCGTKGNLGLTHRFCPNCSAPQNPDSRYYPSDEDKVEVHDHQYVGVDVTCPSCNELNSAAAEFCGQCGSPLTEGARAKTLDPQWRSAHEQFASSGSRDVVKERFEADLNLQLEATKSKPKRKSGSPIRTFVVLGIIAAIVFAVFNALTATKDVTVKVVDHEWERTVTIQEYSNFRTDSWRDSRPSGDNVSIVPGSCEREQRSTRRVADGQTCQTVRQDNGDGTFSQRQECTTNYREEPVYDDMCTWTGQRWQNSLTEDTGGGFAISPYWADDRLDLNCMGLQQIGCERVGSRQETYAVIYQDQADETLYRCTYSQAEWASIEEDSIWVGQARALIPDSLLCASLESK
ncbi:MAG: zinc ribbon domain-containing protein [Chloroflexota bacterium]